MLEKRKNTGFILFGIGILFILCAAALYGYNLYCTKTAEAASADIAAQLEAMIFSDDDNDSAQGNFNEESAPEELIIDGKSYIGILSVPSLELWLPVRSELSYPALLESPCCYSGSISDSNLVIAAHNYPSHFRRLGRLANGETVEFIDAGGRVTQYTVIQTEILAPDEVTRMIDSDYDLTLFTCTPGGASRATVRCEQI